MFKGIVLFFVLSTSLVFAQSSTIYGNLIRIPFDATQINPADTMGSWENYENGFTRYIGVVHSPQSTFFEKYRYNDYGSGWTISDLFLEEFENQTSESYGS